MDAVFDDTCGDLIDHDPREGGRMGAMGDGAPSPTGFPDADQIWQALYKTNQPPLFQLQNLNSRRCLVVQGRTPRTQAIQAGCDTRFLDQFWRQTQS